MQTKGKVTLSFEAPPKLKVEIDRMARLSAGLSRSEYMRGIMEFAVQEGITIQKDQRYNFRAPPGKARAPQGHADAVENVWESDSTAKAAEAAARPYGGAAFKESPRSQEQPLEQPRR